MIDRNNGKQISAKSLPLPAPRILEPRNDAEYEFSDTLQPMRVKFELVPRAYVYRIVISIYYLDILITGDTLYQTKAIGLANHYVDNPPDYSSTRINYGETRKRELPLDYMLNVFRATVPVDDDVKVRYLHHLDFTVWIGNEDLKKYLMISQTFNDNRRQFFTNINNGYGVFAASNHATASEIRPSYGFMYRLHTFDQTVDLRFAVDIYRGKFHSIRSGSPPANGFMLRSNVNTFLTD